MIRYAVGVSLGANSNIESGIAIKDIVDDKLIYLDKYYSMNDISLFFDNYASIKDSIILVSLPWDNTMLEGKWRVLSKSYQLINSNKHFLNRDNWMQRFSTRGSDFFLSLKEKCAQIYRYEIYLARQRLSLYSNYKERSTSDCKFLQSILKTEFGYTEFPTNMLPAAQLEAIVGVILAEERLKDNTDKIFEYSKCDVINIK